MYKFQECNPPVYQVQSLQGWQFITPDIFCEIAKCLSTKTDIISLANTCKFCYHETKKSKYAKNVEQCGILHIKDCNLKKYDQNTSCLYLWQGIYHLIYDVTHSIHCQFALGNLKFSNLKSFSSGYWLSCVKSQKLTTIEFRCNDTMTGSLAYDFHNSWKHAFDLNYD